MQVRPATPSPKAPGHVPGNPGIKADQPTDPKWKAALEFESLFLNQLMKGMRETVLHNESSQPSPERQTFTEMLDQQYANLSSRSLANQNAHAPQRAEAGTSHSLAAQIYRSMLRQDAGPISEIPAGGMHGGFRPPLPLERSTRPLTLPGHAPGAAMPRTQPLDEATLRTLSRDAALKHGLPAELIRSVIQAESGGDTLAVSKAGAKGLMQLMDGTAADLGVSNSFDPAANVDGGAKYLKYLLQRFDGDVSKALAGYNAGPANVDKHGGIPPFPETKAYVKSVMTRMSRYTQTSGE